MKRHYLFLLILFFLTVILITPCTLKSAADRDDRVSPPPNLPRRRQDIASSPEERIDRIINRLKQTDPERAEELIKLREDDPEKFQNELHKTMRADLNKQLRRQKREELRPETNRGIEGRVLIDERGAAGASLTTRRRMEYMQWLKGSFPQEAKKLDQLRKEDPDNFDRQLRLSMKKYGRVFEASKRNPKLAEVLKEELEFKELNDNLLDKFGTETDKSKKKELKKELEELAGRSFDLNVRKKEIRHEQLVKKLEELEEKVKQSKADIKKWKKRKFKRENIRATVENLISSVEKPKWEQK